MVKGYIYGLAGFLAAVLILGLSDGKITGSIVKDEKPLIIYFPKITDFKNTEQGGINFGFSFPDATFKVGEKDADFLLFLESSTVPGLKIGYDPKSRKIKGGLPIIETPEVNILDGKNHNIIYTFHSGHGRQAIILDDKMLIEGDYTGEMSGALITGAVVRSSSEKVASDLDIDVNVW